MFFGVIYVQLGGRDKRNLIDFHTLSIIEANPGRIMVETLSRLNSTSSLTSVIQQRSPENHRAYDYLQSVDCFGPARSHTFWESQFSIKVQWTSNAGHRWQHNKVFVDQCCTNILFPSLFTLSQFLLYKNRNKMLCLTWWPWICWNWVSLRLRLHINLTIFFLIPPFQILFFVQLFSALPWRPAPRLQTTEMGQGLKIEALIYPCTSFALGDWSSD